MSLTVEQVDSMRLLVERGIRTAADVLCRMLQTPVQVQVQRLGHGAPGDVPVAPSLEVDDACTAIQVDFRGDFEGRSMVLLSNQAADELVRKMTGESDAWRELDAVRQGTLMEFGNIVLQGVVGTMANDLGCGVDFSLPVCLEDRFRRLVASPRAGMSSFLAQAGFAQEGSVLQGELLLLLERDSYDLLRRRLQAEDGG